MSEWCYAKPAFDFAQDQYGTVVYLRKCLTKTWAASEEHLAAAQKWETHYTRLANSILDYADMLNEMTDEETLPDDIAAVLRLIALNPQTADRS